VAGNAAGLERAFVVSLALHGAVLAGISLPEHAVNFAVDSPVLITARLVEPAPVEAGEEKPVAKLKSRPVEKKISEIKIPEPNTPDAAIPPVPAATAAAPATPTVAAAAAFADPATVTSYRAQLLGAAGRFKRYPEEARENNWTGNVVVGVAIDGNGTANVGVRRSSGYVVLDQQALEMFRQAARAVPLPEPLRGREFSLQVRAVYGLED